MVVVQQPVFVHTDLSLLQHVLPLTNFSQLSSVQLLDEAGRSHVTKRDMRQLMQLHQDMFCA